MQLKELIEQLQTYIVSNEKVKRFHFDFRDQLDVIVPKHKSFPIVYVAPDVTNTISNINGYFGQEVSLEVFVLDRINDDRTNILTIMNETSNIINDIIIFFKNHPNITIDDFFNVQPYNDYTVDNLAGNTITISFLVTSKSACYMPTHTDGGEGIIKILNSLDEILDSVVVPTDSIVSYKVDDSKANIRIENQDGVLIVDKEYDIPATETINDTIIVNTSGTSITLSNSDDSWSETVVSDTVLEDTVVNFYLNGILQETVSVPYHKDETINIQ